MIFVIRFVQRFTALGLAFLLTFATWCGGFAGDASAMLLEMRSKTAPECTQHDTAPANESSQNSGFPCVFRSLDLVSQGGTSSVPAHDNFNYGHFISFGSSEQMALATRFRTVPESLATKIFPHLLFSVLNL